MNANRPPHRKLVVKGICLTLLFCLFLLPKPSAAQNKAERIEELMDIYHEYGLFHGSILVAQNGKVIYQGGRGLADVEWDIPNDTDTKHRLGSITKQFTAMLILQLVEQGKLDLQVPISTYLPDYPQPNANIITTHQLLIHTSGLPNYTGFPKAIEEHSRDPFTPQQFIPIFSDSTLEFQPGEKFHYNNTGYFLLGVIIENITGQSYEEVLKEKILTPLGMHNTGYDHQAEIIKKRAKGYARVGDDLINAPYLDMSIPFAAGAMYSTVEDLSLWDQALYTEQLISQKYLDMMFTPFVISPGGHYGYGWGVVHVQVPGRREKILVLKHAGGISGFNTLLARTPENKSLVVLLNNTSESELEKINKNIGSILFDLPYSLPKRPMARELYNTITTEGTHAAKAQFKDLKADDEYVLYENKLNIMGYRLLSIGKNKEAIALFEMNVEAFPESANTYDSLGESFLADGNKKQALKNYRKAFEMDPSNTKAAEVIQKLEKGK